MKRRVGDEGRREGQGRKERRVGREKGEKGRMGERVKRRVGDKGRREG